MKKTLLFAGILAGTGAFAQTTVTFDDLTLAPNTHYDGSDLSGGFTSGGIFFPNEYNDQWDYWSGGFIYSSSTDNTTAGYTNDFSAYTGEGATGSANYGVNYGSGHLDFGTEKALISISVTNTTFAALSMLDGDAFGKQFGSVNNAQGTPDGTNGEDFFRLLITGYDADNDSIGTITFYLADYRFADNSEDYIVNEWKNIDLTPLGNIRYLDFALESSDNNENGMLTPAYFALDNFVYNTVTGIEENPALAVAIYPNPVKEHVIIKGLAGTITVTDASGATVYTGETNGLRNINCENWSNGYYIVTFANENGVHRSSLVKN